MSKGEKAVRPESEMDGKVQEICRILGINHTELRALSIKFDPGCVFSAEGQPLRTSWRVAISTENRMDKPNFSISE